MSLHDYQPTDDLARATTIPAAWYLAPEMLARERDAIFARTWQPVARAAELARPGDYVTCTLAGEPLVLVHGRDGRVRGFYNVCRHRAGPVAEGRGNRQTLQCRYHGWTYDLDGRLRRAPETAGMADWDAQAVCLPEVACAVWGPLVLASLDATRMPLAELLAPIDREIAGAGMPMQGLHLAERRDYEVAANWKVYIDNYLEGYHIPVVHPGLHRELDYEQYRVETHRWHSAQHAPLRPAQAGGSGRVYEPAAGHAGDKAAARALYYWIFPNWMLNVYPDNLQINVVTPIDAGRTSVRFEWYVADPGDAAGRERLGRAIAFGDEVQREDATICEAVQRGLGSRSYQRGRLVPARENGMHHFHRLLHEMLAARDARG
jgi:choline monooxygenase